MDASINEMTSTKMILFDVQDARNSLSVTNLNMRTTSSLESFNAILNRSIAKNAHFFKFLLRLRIHESRKTDEMHYMAHHILPDSQFERRKQRDRERENKIQFFSAKLLSGRFTTAEFLLAMAADENGMQKLRLSVLRAKRVFVSRSNRHSSDIIFFP